MKDCPPFEYKLEGSHLNPFTQQQRTISKLGIDSTEFAELHSFSLQNFSSIQEIFSVPKPQETSPMSLTWRYTGF
jgi:hypothetical protein